MHLFRSTRRRFLGGMAAARPLMAADSGEPQGIDYYEKLGVTKIINAAGTYTALTASIMPPPVQAAVARAAKSRLGFIQRVDIRQMDHSVGYYWLPEEKGILSIGPSVSYTAIWDHTGKLTDWYASADFSIDFAKSSGFHLTRSEGYEFLDVRGYRSHRNGISFYSDTSKRLSLYGSFSRGTATNYSPAAGLEMFTGAAMDASFGFTYRATSRVRVDEYYFFDHLATLPAMREAGGTVFTSHTMRTKVNYQFTRALSARAIVDYNGVLPNVALFNDVPYKRIASDVLLTYMLNSGTAVYVGYSDGHENLNIPNGGPYSLARFGFPGTLTSRQFFVKLNYLFRF